MGFPWYSKVKESEPINWDTVSKSADLYFLRENLRDQCAIVFVEREELYVFRFEDMKFENEDNWEVERE